MRKLVAVLALFLCLTRAQAGYQSGNDLLTDCNGAGSKIACYGYLMAAVDTYITWNTWGDIRDQMCIPDGVTPEQLRLIVVKHMEGIPERLHNTASSFVLNALMQAFPCE